MGKTQTSGSNTRRHGADSTDSGLHAERPWRPRGPQASVPICDASPAKSALDPTAFQSTAEAFGRSDRAAGLGLNMGTTDGAPRSAAVPSRAA